MAGGGGKPLRIGPFTGGLNTSSDPTAIADAELAICLNFELDIDGSLRSRPPFQELAGDSGWTERILLIGTALFNSTDHYLIGSNANGVYHYINGTWTLITDTFEAAVAIQYSAPGGGSTIYLVPKPGGGTGGKWDPVGGFTAISAIPQGQAAQVHKDRLFIVPGSAATSDESRLKFSDPADFESFPASNFIDVNPGDGTNLVDITVFQDNILLFKNRTSFVLAYDTDPAAAVLRQISLTIGVNSQHNVVNYENQIYLFHDGWIYEIINYDFHRLNTKVPFIEDKTAPSSFSEGEDVFLSLLGDRVICRFFRNIYVYGLRTRTWSEWESEKDVLHYFGPIVTLHKPDGEEFYAGSALTANTSIIRLHDDYTLQEEEVLDPDLTLNDTFTRTVADGWGTSDSGHAWTPDTGDETAFSVNGNLGEAVPPTTGRENGVNINSSITGIQNIDRTMIVQSQEVATGDWLVIEDQQRIIDSDNHYFHSVEFKDDGNVGHAIYLVSGGSRFFQGGFVLGTYSANEKFNARFQIIGTTLKAKLWRNADPEPEGWDLDVTEDTITGAHDNSNMKFIAQFNNTNADKTLKVDDYKLSDANNTAQLIKAEIKTKNFDMAVSHQFKRLWWWGADVVSNNAVTGVATPIQLAFKSTWDDLSAFTWDQLNTWSQPLTTPGTVTTVRATGTGVARRFAKFLKSLRYRQINFDVKLDTGGSTRDGPARIFTLTAITETKQTVPKGLN